MKSKITFILVIYLIISLGISNSLKGASFTGSGTTFTINIDDASTTVSIVSTATGYTFTLSSGTWTGSATGATISGLNLTIDATGLSAYDTFTITDGAAGAAVTFNGSGANTYNDNFNINLDGDGAGGIPGIVTFNGASSFTLSNAISVITTTNIVFNSGSSLSTIDGNLTLDANTQLPYTTLAYNGIFLNNASIRTIGTGTAMVKGCTNSSSGSYHGIYILENSIISGGTSGCLTVQGWGSNNIGSSYGVSLFGSSFTPTITSTGADVSVTGSAFSTTGSSYGISLGSFSSSSLKGLITSGVNGNVTVTGFGSLNSTGNGNYGVMAGALPSITSGGSGLVKVTGWGGGTSTSGNNYGIIISNGAITSGENGSVELIGNGGTGSTGTQNNGITINKSSITCGTGNGTVKMTGTGGGKEASSYNYGISLSALGATITAGGSGSVTVTGQGGTNVTGNNNYGILIAGTVQPYPIISSNGGNVNVSGTGGGINSATNYGVNISAGTITSDGLGEVTVSGQGGNQTGTSGNSNYGIYMSGDPYISQITSKGGNISVNGTGGGGSGSTASNSTNNYGISLTSYTSIKAGGNGSINVTGKGGNNSTGGTGGSNFGVNLSGYSAGKGTMISSTNGAVTVIGTGGGDGGSGALNYGVNLYSGASITSEGAGSTITVTGNGGSSNGHQNYGVYVTAGTSPNFSNITSGGGNVSVNGTGGGIGASATNYGVLCDTGGKIMAGGTGTVTVVGQGGNPTGSGSNNNGVRVYNNAATITSNGGNVSVTGTGGGGTTSTSNYGVDVNTNSVITAGGTGNVTVTGNGGNLSGSGTNNHGVNTYVSNSSITSGGGNVIITGKEGGQTGSIALSFASGSISTATNGGNISLVGNTINLGSTTILSSKSTGSISLLQRTDGVGFDLGSATNTNGGPIALSSTEFGRISGGGTVNIGNANTGNINFSALVTNSAGINKLNLSSPSGKGIVAAVSGTDLSIGTNSLGFGSDSPLKVNINGSTVDTQYDQLKVTGTVDLSGAALTLTGSYTPIGGNVFTIVSATTVTGTFTGLAEGATVTFNGIPLTINYTATTVTLTPPCTNPTSGGTIGSDQQGGSPFDPVAFTSSAAATGHSGSLEYKWQSSTTNGSTDFSDIASSNSETYDPGSLTVTTWYKRLARVGCKSDWTGAVESNALAITVSSGPSDQPTNLNFSNTKTGSDFNIVVNYAASASADGYLVVRKTGSAPTFVPVNGTSYSIGAQGSDQIVYVGSALTCTDAAVTSGTAYFYAIYAYKGSGGSIAYLTTSPLSGNSTLYNSSPGAIASSGSTSASAGFPNAGVNVTFPGGTTGTTLTVTKTAAAPASNFSVLPGVRGVKNLYFTITSSNATPGTYTLVMDFSDLGLTSGQWANFKVLKRADAASAWIDVTTLGATIVNRQTDGVWGKFTISGLTSFSEFVVGESFDGVIVSNLSEGIIAAMGGNASMIKAQAFTTNGTKYDLTSVTLSIWNSDDPSNAVLKLYSALANGEIDFANGILVTFGTPSLGVLAGDNYNAKFAPSSPTNYTLQANTTYWLVFNSSTTSDFNTTLSLTSSGVGTLPAINNNAMSDDGGSSYTYYNDQPFMISVNGNIMPTLITWDGSTDTDWNTAANWDLESVPISDNLAIIPGTGVTNFPVVNEDPSTPATCYDLTINAGGMLTIATGKALNVNGNLLIKSDANGTGSLKILGSVSGSATVQRYMVEDKWHVVSAPATENINTFLNRNLAIPIVTGGGSDNGKLGMTDYNTTGNVWNGYFPVGSDETGGSFVSGKGYLVRTVAPSPTILDFKGSLYAGTKNVTVSLVDTKGWNCIGNPYTSAIKLGDGTVDASGSDNFLDVNSSKMDDVSFGAYVYIGNGSANGYTVINYAAPYSGIDTYASLGQGFFVKAKTNGITVAFTPAMQFHIGEGVAPFKAAVAPAPSIKLIVTNSASTSSTDILFIEGTTKGLDRGYDAGILKADPSFAIYTKLVEPFDA
ncbi:MAG: hypothetical protein WCP85_28605, partial [Mariniphaga sp.]